MKILTTRLLSLTVLVFWLSACVLETRDITAISYPNPDRFITARIQQHFAQPSWQLPGQLEIPGISQASSMSNQIDWLRSYFKFTYPNIPSTEWHHFGHGDLVYDDKQQVVGLSESNAFDAKHRKQAFFEPALPLEPVALADYQQRLRQLQASQQTLKGQIDVGSIQAKQGYLAASFAPDTQWLHSGLAWFFPASQRPTNRQQLIYGVLLHHLPTTQAQKAWLPLRMDTLYFDWQQQLFYWMADNGKPMWLYALSHPTEQQTVLWQGDHKKHFKQVSAIGGNCGISVRTWFQKKVKLTNPNGYSHLGFGQVRYDKQKRPVALTAHIAFDEEHAENLIFEPSPPLPAPKLKDYRARITLLKAKQQSLAQALDTGEISAEQEYIGSSDGTQSLSHTGILRFYSPEKRRYDCQQQVVYGEFIHNWNKAKRKGPLTISAVYRDPKYNLFFWVKKNGNHKKMWIYGLASPLLAE
ncbi:hypothetical protein QUF61_16320 [Candidatus Venteria ishoeyi]|uniref:hypothetical protein n=1 Tax=Candidatus Venteria ishoeyi TaxID=1899563 RepID=UPI0025A68D4D|nr:hypothetical protein [Candidatus Venteria ishoeyi]MDM8548054.1 hypothetical protein [Candidatus Venteria ishoeyi]